MFSNERFNSFKSSRFEIVKIDIIKIIKNIIGIIVINEKFS